jgi:hypothetical protein
MVDAEGERFAQEVSDNLAELALLDWSAFLEFSADLAERIQQIRERDK